MRSMPFALLTVLLAFGAACAHNDNPTASAESSAARAAVLAADSPMRGTLLEMTSRSPGQRYRLDYYDGSEPDSSYKELSARGMQGGGPTWAGIVKGLLLLRCPGVLTRIALDDESDGLAIWSDDREALEIIGRLIGAAKKDPALLNEAIARAKRENAIE
jgi:hypothetical protein